MKRRTSRREKGITLIALAVTIVILVILSGVIIATLKNSNLLENVKLSKKKYDNSIYNENKTLEQYTNKIDDVGIFMATRDGNIKRDLKAEVISYRLTETKAGVTINILEPYEEAVYVYIINNQIVDFSKNILFSQNNLEPNKEYQINVICVEQNGNVHDFIQKIKITNSPVDVYKTVGDVSKLNEYGINYKYVGYAQTKYTDLYNLGMGSAAGINTNTYTLTIDYETLLAKLDKKTYKGIYANFWQSSYADSGYTSTCWSEITINYKNNTQSNAKTDMTSAKNSDVSENKSAFILFEKEKEIKNIQLIIHEYDSNSGRSYGSIKEINLLD